MKKKKYREIYQSEVKEITNKKIKEQQNSEQKKTNLQKENVENSILNFFFDTNNLKKSSDE